MKTIFYKSLIFLSVIALLLAGYSASSESIKVGKKHTEAKAGNTEEGETVLKAVTFEATPSFFQSSFQRFSFLIFSFEFDLGKTIPLSTFFPTFIDLLKQVLFSRISPTNAP